MASSLTGLVLLVLGSLWVTGDLAGLCLLVGFSASPCGKSVQ